MGYLGVALRLAFPLFYIMFHWYFFRCSFWFRCPHARNLVMIFAQTKSTTGSRIARMEIQVFWNENNSQTNAYLHYSNYSYSGLTPNERTLREPSISWKLHFSHIMSYTTFVIKCFYTWNLTLVNIPTRNIFTWRSILKTFRFCVLLWRKNLIDTFCDNIFHLATEKRCLSC